MNMRPLAVAVCTYNRCERLPQLVAALREQTCPVPYTLLFVDNNSSDGTSAVLREIAARDGAPLRYVHERSQGIVHARNRAIEETKGSDYLVFIDDDELPAPGWLAAAYDALANDGAHCVGGRIRVMLPTELRPRWLGDELLGFLGEVDYGADAFWIKSTETPVWTGNIAYRTSVFADGLRFDSRYNREGTAVGGGEDAMMFRALLARGTPIRYRPDMAIDHMLETWKLRRRYFLELHYAAGRRKGLYEERTYAKTVAGIPSFMITIALKQGFKALAMAGAARPGYVRQAMLAMHSLGYMRGCLSRHAAAHSI